MYQLYHERISHLFHNSSQKFNDTYMTVIAKYGVCITIFMIMICDELARDCTIPTADNH